MFADPPATSRNEGAGEKSKLISPRPYRTDGEWSSLRASKKEENADLA